MANNPRPAEAGYAASKRPEPKIASGLASGRYPWSITVTSPDMAAPATVSGYVIPHAG